MWGRKEEPARADKWSPRSEPEPATPAQPSATASPEVAARTPEPESPKGAQIGKGLHVKGEIAGSEDLYIDGEVEGAVELKGNSLTVGPNGKVRADLKARSITILGYVKGNLEASEKVEIRKTGSLEGDLVTASIMIEEGAMFRGSIDIAKPSPRQSATASAKKSSSSSVESAPVPRVAAARTNQPQPQAP